MKTITLAAAAVLFSSAALADEFRFVYPSSYLANPDGVERLHARLERQVDRHCRAQFIGLNPRGVSACSEELMEKVVERIGNPRLAAYQARVEAERRG